MVVVRPGEHPDPTRPPSGMRGYRRRGYLRPEPAAGTGVLRLESQEERSEAVWRREKGDDEGHERENEGGSRDGHE